MYITVSGMPATKGSWRAINTPKGARLQPQCKNSKPWEARVALAAQEYMRGRAPYGISVVVVLCFWLPRPKGHYGTGRNASKLKPSAPAWPNAKNRHDIDKLARCALDALSGIVYTDDAQVVAAPAIKMYGNPPGCCIRVLPMTTAMQELFHELAANPGEKYLPEQYTLFGAFGGNPHGGHDGE